MPLNSFLEKSIFDLKITIPRVHPVQISSHSDYCITTGIMYKHWKCWKNDQVSKIGVVPTIQPEPNLLLRPFAETIEETVSFILKGVDLIDHTHYKNYAVINSA